MDLSLYTTKTLVEMHPNHPVEIRSQMEQTSDENWAPNMEKPVWYCTSSRAHTSIAKYAEYQAETIRDHFQQTVNIFRQLATIFSDFFIFYRMTDRQTPNSTLKIYLRVE